METTTAAETKREQAVRSMYHALGVVTLDPKTVEYLSEHDPQALRQCLEAFQNWTAIRDNERIDAYTAVVQGR